MTSEIAENDRDYLVNSKKEYHITQLYTPYRFDANSAVHLKHRAQVGQGSLLPALARRTAAGHEVRRY